MTSMTPRQIVIELDKHIIGQNNAKRAVAIALRNRWRRQQVAEPLCQEITPKNILMIGPTGVGKTEIARRLAKLANAPFIKIEATKFTEVGYVGRDVDTIIRDLLEVAIKDTRETVSQHIRSQAEEVVEEKILDMLLPPTSDLDETARAQHNRTRNRLRKKLRNGDLDTQDIDIEVSATGSSMEIFAPPGMEELTGQIQSMFQSLVGQKRKKKKMTIGEARRLLTDEEISRFINEDDVKTQAIINVEQNGIVFLDEIDKIALRGDSHNTDVSRQGVQRDLLPLVEGTTVSTKYGMIKTDHILFIASGAFHLSKPSDLIPELQGRFPIRVELESLSIDDFERILIETDACLTKQYEALLATEDVHIIFSSDGIRCIAEIAFEVNKTLENIGARRLYTVLEKIVEEISFTSGEKGQEETVAIDAAYVTQHVGELAKSLDYARYVL